MIRAMLLLAALWPLLGATVAWGQAAPADAPLKVLFLSKSSGFVHPVIAGKDGAPSTAEAVLQKLADSEGFELQSTKDASLINEAFLAQIDAVVFYTSGDLTVAGEGSGLFGGDAETAMGPNGLTELIQWIESGGALLGFHSASDTFHGEEGTVSPFIELLGGEFRVHGAQFTGTLEIVDPSHPTAAHLPREPVRDEWYLFMNMNPDVHVVANLDPGSARTEQARLYDVENYPVVWTRSPGSGRVFYNAMGHRPDVWQREDFQQAFLDALYWATKRDS